MDADGKPLGVALFRDATRPHIRTPVLVFLAAVGIALLAVDWANGSARLLSDSLSRAALLGIVYGVFVAYCDIAVGVDETAVIVRNPFLLTRVPFALIESVDTQLGVYLKLRDRKLAVRVGAATTLFRRRRSGPASIAVELRDLVAAAPKATSESVRIRVKWTWFAALPLSVGLFVAVDLISRAAH